MRNLSIKMNLATLTMKRVARKFAEEKGEFALSSVIGVAVGLIIAAFVLIPGMRSFASAVLTALNAWWSGNILPAIFPNS